MQKLINRVWLGDPIPPKFKQYGEEFQELNPDYKINLWNEDMVFGERWINQDVIDTMIAESKQPGADMVAFYTHVVDVICYELVYRYGGWYFNTDVKPVKPLDQLEDVHHVNFNFPIIAKEDDYHAVNMAMYAPPKNPVFKQFIEEIPKRYFNNPGAFMNFSTGAQMMMQVLNTTHHQYQLLGRKVFNPIHFTDFGYGQEPDMNIEITNATFGIHSWGHRHNCRGQRILER